MNLTRMGFDGAYILKHQDGREVQVKEVVKHAHDGKSWLITGGTAPHNENSTGKIFVRDALAIASIDRTFYPSVFDMKWDKVQKP